MTTTRNYPRRADGHWLADLLCWRKAARFAPVCHGELLDVGCGDRRYEPLIRPYVRSYVGLEHPETSMYREHVDIWGDATALPFEEGSFDTVVSFQVLEHVPEPATAVREAFRVLRPEGTYLISTPFMWGLHNEPYDFFRYTPHGLRHLLESTGFVDVVIEPWADSCQLWGIRSAAFINRRYCIPAVISATEFLGATAAALLDTVGVHDTVDAGGYYAVARRP